MRTTVCKGAAQNQYSAVDAGSGSTVNEEKELRLKIRITKSCMILSEKFKPSKS